MLLTEQNIRIRELASATGIPATRIGNWYDRGQVMPIAKQEDGWRIFSHADVAKLAIVMRLIDWGARVEEADHAAAEILFNGPMLTYRNAPAEALIAKFIPVVVVIWRDDGRIYFEILRRGEPLPGIPDTFLVIDVHAAIRQAFQRLREFREAQQ
ncbi:MerR family transcriptional regulator [Rhodomicrobium vannielii ATCC 17100]|uniref:MerR family transcriptional regulator n=1 Tax=Rhodomicrobium vannielii TaxID=1069 RepID=UPI00191AFF73|nr:MerR family transcriptional regulator [Rhodomicrobium vannielii]MBJ7535435.1 MerR family transcriptional regulator [Rhodomicrobium vannielii ATCC 17100]